MWPVSSCPWLKRAALPLLAVGLWLLGALLLASHDLEANLSDRVAKRSAVRWALQSTAVLLTVPPSPPLSAQAVCAGVFLARDTVLTAQHCVENRLPWLVVRPYDGNDVRASAVLMESKERDLAVLRLHQPVEQARPAPLTTDVAVGDDVFVIGSPLGQSFILTQGVISKIYPHLAFSNPTPENVLGTKRQQILLTDAGAISGNSGGPLFDEGGNLLGVIVRIWPSTVALHGFAVGGESIRAFLQGR